MPSEEGRYIVLISPHGLIRGTNLELGRDADTGGQTKYVVELAQALVEHPDVAQVDLITRLIEDPRVDAGYAEPFEDLASGAQIVRIECGPAHYIPKESLWPHVDGFVDNIVQYFRSQDRVPDLLHAHYADAGFVCSRLAALLHLPMAFTGHSLGRVKRQRLLDGGMKAETIEKRYKISRRIEAEETALDHAGFVVASTRQEVDEQYAQYDNYQPNRMVVIPPGVDLSRFRPPSRRDAQNAPIFSQIVPFLMNPDKPMILALSRPDPRKNIPTLIRAYGENPRLQEAANLVVVAGTREDLREMDKGTREVLQEILYLVDFYNLYGRIAYPKQHQADDVPDLFRLAASTRGVFINPALTEPFGLTLIEAAASGLPIVATEDGGPRDILEACQNGVLIDPLDVPGMGEALLKAVSDRDQWKRWSRAGIKGAHNTFSWSAHVNRYMKAARPTMAQTERKRAFYSKKSRLITADRIVVSDIDNTLIGDRRGLQALLQRVREAGDRVAFGIATGRSLELTEEVLKEWKIPTPQLLITGVGSAIHYGSRLVEDTGWTEHLSYRWNPDGLRKAMKGIAGLKLQPPEGQGPYKISYFTSRNSPPKVRDIVRKLRRSNLHARVIYSHGAYLDLLPIRASKGMALRYFAYKWGFPLEHCLVAGDSGNDEEMLTGNALAVVVGNHDEELDHLRGEPRIYFAGGHYAWGIVEGIDHYNFFGEIRIPEPVECENE